MADFSSSSSSSSSMDITHRELRVPLIQQGHHTLIPFTWIRDDGTSCSLGKNSEINFTVQASDSPYLDYEAVVDRNNGIITSIPSVVNEPDTYVPQDPNSLYEHRNSFYTDVIGNDVNGIKNVRFHVEPAKYDIEDTNECFITPKFTWNLNESNVSSSFSTSFWVGTEDNTINKVILANNSISLAYSANTSSMVNNILFASNNNKIYVSTDVNLYKYSSDEYWESNSENKELVKILNSNNSSMVLDDDNWIWSVESNLGKIAKLNPDTLENNLQISNMDGPFKIKKSEYHNVYIVSGEHVLWKVNNGNIEDIYEINGYNIVDFDISESGIICLLLHSDLNDILRILSNDFYTFLLNETITDGTLKFCRYCGEGRFYILNEISSGVATGSTLYDAYHYVFDITDNSLTKTYASERKTVTTTTTTLPYAPNPINILNPYLGENVVLGKEYEIKWTSNKSSTDYVKIELYRNNAIYGVLSKKYPNNGLYKWDVSQLLDLGDDYKIYITWFSTTNTSGNYVGMSNNFSLVEKISITTTTTTTVIPDTAIGIIYNLDYDFVIIALRSGLFNIFRMGTKEAESLNNIGVNNLTCIANGNDSIGVFDRQKMVRIFVGTANHLSDAWDSGIIDTELTSMYYGGGKNLVPGRKYYVNIQVYSVKKGWSELQTKEFVMPI